MSSSHYKPICTTTRHYYYVPAYELWIMNEPVHELLTHLLPNSHPNLNPNSPPANAKLKVLERGLFCILHLSLWEENWHLIYQDYNLLISDIQIRRAAHLQITDRIQEFEMWILLQATVCTGSCHAEIWRTSIVLIITLDGYYYFHISKVRLIKEINLDYHKIIYKTKFDALSNSAETIYEL
jgi:hypothetical protein